MTWLAIPALAAAIVVPLVAVATLRIEGGSRRGLGMAGFLMLFGAAEAAAAVVHLTPQGGEPPLTASRWAYTLGVLAYLPMIEFLGDLARRSGAERPLGVPLSIAEAGLRLLCVGVLLLIAGSDLGLSGLEPMADGVGWRRVFGPAWPVFGIIGTLYVSWGVACWDGERRRRGRVDADMAAWLAAVLLLTCGPIVTSTLLPASGLAHSNAFNGVATVLGGFATVTGLILSRRLQLQRLAPKTEDGETTLEEAEPPDFEAHPPPQAPPPASSPRKPVPVVLACTGCRAQYRELPEDAVCSQDGHPVQTSPDPLIGRVVAGRWRILSFLGSGGMARVYAAEHHRLGQRSAIKVIWGDLLGDSRAFERFMREAQACRALESRYIIKLEDVAELQEGLPMLVLELVEGESFDRHLSSTGPLPVAHAALFASQVAAGLADAHAGKVIHRDLKPANVMVVHGADRDTAKIVDFGLAMQMDLAGATKLTQSGTVTGTPAYLAPEQIMGEPPTTASDLYALGVMIYETVTGVQPFVGFSPQEVCAKHLYKKPNMRRMKGPLRDIVGGLLNKKPEDRLGDAAEVSRQLAEVAGAERRFGPPLSG